MAPVLRAADPHPDASPCLRQQRIESGAPGRQREIQCAQRVGRKETVQRKAVTPDFRIVYLFSGSIRPFSVSWPPSAVSVEASE